VTSNIAVGADAALIVGTSKGSIEEWFGPPPVTSTSDKPTWIIDLWPRRHRATLAETSARAGRADALRRLRSGLHALIRAAMMIRTGEVRQALVVATEGSVHPLFLGSFQRLGVLARPGEGCRPFDRNRTGFYMSEATCRSSVSCRSRATQTAAGDIRVENFASAATRRT
jgi:hypothetical protein